MYIILIKTKNNLTNKVTSYLKIVKKLLVKNKIYHNLLKEHYNMCMYSLLTKHYLSFTNHTHKITIEILQ